MEKYGFVYIWYDRKHKRYYIGCHWGTTDDGYICSSSWMKQAYKVRPNDFNRRILVSNIPDKQSMFEEEYRYLSMIKKEELKVRYYNVMNHHFSHWSTSSYADEIRKSASEKLKDKHNDPEFRQKYLESRKNVNTRQNAPEVREKKRQSMKKTMAEKFPEENRRKKLTPEQRKEYYSNKAKEIHNNRTDEQKQEVCSKISQGLKGKQNRLGQKNSDEHRKKISQTQTGMIKPKNIVSINGNEYSSCVIASKELGLDSRTVRKRVKSPSYPDWFYVNKSPILLSV